MKVAQQMSLFLAGFLFFGSATIGFKWVTSPYLWGYVAAGLGFLALSFFLGTLEWRVKKARVRRIRFHDLRHTHATMGLRAGVAVKVMSERLGHSTPAFTLQQYAHVIPGMQAEAAAAIAGLLDGLGKPDRSGDAEGNHQPEN